jgi:hypothetical protein
MQNMQNMQNMQSSTPMFHYTSPDGNRVSYTPEQIIHMITHKDKIIESQNQQIQKQNQEINFLKTYYKIT